MKRILLFLFLFPVCAGAQPVNSAYLPFSDWDSLPFHRYDVKVTSNHFVKNNEYFNRFNEGITYIGSTVQPEFLLGFGSKALLSLGWNWRYFYGTSRFNLSLPVVRFDYYPVNNISFTVGQLHGGLEHGLIEPLYSTDNYFVKNPEYGVQARFRGNGLTSDVWMDWEHFLMPGDNQQEQITGGCNIEYALRLKEIGTVLNLQGVVHHFGGQVVESDAPLLTRANLAPGIVLKKNTVNRSRWISDLSAGFYYIQALDVSGKPQLPYKKGFAEYSYVAIQAKWMRVVAAWFHGVYFFSPLGETLFQSVSSLNDWYQMDNRDLLNSKLILEHQLAKGLKGGIRFESYFDPASGNFDFCYGISVRADASLFHHR